MFLGGGVKKRKYQGCTVAGASAGEKEQEITSKTSDCERIRHGFKHQDWNFQQGWITKKHTKLNSQPVGYVRRNGYIKPISTHWITFWPPFQRWTNKQQSNVDCEWLRTIGGDRTFYPIMTCLKVSYTMDAANMGRMKLSTTKPILYEWQVIAN